MTLVPHLTDRLIEIHPRGVCHSTVSEPTESRLDVSFCMQSNVNTKVDLIVIVASIFGYCNGHVYVCLSGHIIIL